MRSSVRWFLVLVSLAVASLPRSALAGDPLARPDSPKACEHLDRGNNLYDAGAFKEAIDEYKAGEVIDPAPVFDYNLGQAHRQLGLYREALWHYDRFLHKGQPTGQLRDAVIAFMAEMRAHLENKAQSMPPTGREPSAEGPPSSAPQVSPPTSIPAVVARHEAWYDDSWGWALSGAGVVGIAVGGVLLADAAGINGDANMTTNQQERDRLREKEHMRNVLGVVVGTGGIGLLALGIVKLAVHPKEQPSTTSWNLTVTGNGLLVFGRF